MKRPFIGRFGADAGGAASLEFGIVGSVFAFLCIGIVQLGLLIWARDGLQTTAALTARCAAIGSAQCSNPQQFAVSMASSWIVGSIIASSNVTAGSTSSCNGQSGTYEVVTITSSSWSKGFLLAPFVGPLTVSECYPINPNPLS